VQWGLQVSSGMFALSDCCLRVLACSWQRNIKGKASNLERDSGWQCLERGKQRDANDRPRL